MKGILLGGIALLTLGVVSTIAVSAGAGVGGYRVAWIGALRDVVRWREIIIPEAISDGGALERFVVKTARENGIALDQPVPFRVLASPERLVLHVLRGSGASPVYVTLEREPVEIVGFYLDKQYGIFTHHDENLHMDGKTTDNRISGHVDQLALARGAKLFLPVAQPR